MDDLRFAELISKIAHELRSPLTSIKGFSATLVKRWDRFSDDQRFQFVETIHSDAERMGRIVSEVLDLARLEAGKLELTPTEVDLVAVASSAAGDVSELDGADRIAMRIEDRTMAWADAERLRHVIGNLLENAVKFSDDGPVTVDARADEGGVAVEIRDEGIGIESHRLDEIFAGPAPAGGHATPSGTGLGLYLSRRLVEAHGGTLSVESEPGVGSVFIVRLPSQRGPA